MNQDLPMGRKQWLAERSVAWRTINLYLRIDGSKKSQSWLATGLTFTPLTPENQCFQPEPLMRLEQEEAQLLMDELWRAGIRPTEGQGSAGMMGAVQKHLEDMRALAFANQKVPKP